MNGNWILRNHPNPLANIRLFCFPYSGATASIYFTWSEILPHTIEVCSIQLPGRGTRLSERLFTKLSDLVEEATFALQPYLVKPFAFFGHSLGSLLIFEITRNLRRKGMNLPVRLFVSGNGSPYISDKNPPIHDLQDVQLIKKLKEINGMTPDVLENNELMELLLPILKADFEMCETYQYYEEAPLDIPISVFGGLEDPFVSRSDLEGWTLQSNQKTIIRVFPGDHFFLSTSKMLLLQVIAQELSPFL